ncbi:FkbM family methyltransferase [Duganella aceris]|uniref:FkbM family methyltransferase n=1 Tax=Duganella aceris TaxID=2703883 RepID=A0ABX0FPZ2_9BURK|nr:FkbM family methyltransferase [Duganella aceris]NGZ86537.1 FkbM family methyltransferase [Duganella aceris]
MSLTSYAPNFEDVLLMRALRHVERGFYIDAAAGAPLQGNATQAFYQHGWRGVNLEPAPAPLRDLRIARPADVNLALAAAAAPDRRDWYDIEGEDGTFDADLALQRRAAGREVVRRSVELQTLDAVCAQHAPAQIHFLKLGERAALDGLDLQRRRPWIILLRDAGTTALPALEAQGYRLAHAGGLHQFYVAAEHATLAAALALPPHPADAFLLCEDHPYAQPLAKWRQAVAAAEQEAASARDWAQAHVREWREKFDRLETEQRRGDTAERQLEEMALRAYAAEAELPLQQQQQHEREHVLQQQRHELEQTLQQREQALQQQQQQTEQQRARADAAEAQLPPLRQHATYMEQTLHGVYASLSWRLTYPLRWGKLTLSRLRAFARALPGRAVRATRRRVKGLAGAALRYVTARPRLSFFLRRNISRLPFMVPVMRALKLRLQLNNAHAPSPEAAPPPAPTNLDGLPEAARQVFDDLRRARRQSPHS